MSEQRARLAHVPALDGLRGVAVALVVAFHAGRLTGGWLGVDVFFVLSGYLITRLLLVEATSTGRIDLARFWGRRARRLLPAMLITVAVVAVAERVRERLAGPAGARWDVVGALTYTSNWLRLRAGAGYWSQFGPPSLLEHFWSLAIEEQFYVLWPLVMVGLARLRRATVTVVLAIATVAGAAWSLVLFDRTLDASRVYMGTDTRAYALLAGATVASLAEWRPNWIRPARWIAPVASGALALGAAGLDGTRLVTYRGGLVGCTLAAALVVAGLATGTDRLAGLLSVSPLRWLGARSYGIYLWHWPVFAGCGIAGRPDAGLGRIAVGVLASLAIAEASYRLVEMPIRRKGLRVVRWRPALPFSAALLTGAAIVAVSAPLGEAVPVAAARRPPALAEAGVGGSNPAPPAIRDRFAGVPRPAASNSPATTVVAGAAGRPVEPSSSARSAGGSGSAAGGSGSASTIALQPTDADEAARARIARPSGRRLRVLIVGDSVGWHLGEQMVADQAAADVEVRNLAVPACPPSYTAILRRRDAGSVPIEFSPECADALAALPFEVEGFRPDVSFVLFGGSFFDENLIGADLWSSPCENAFDDWHRMTMTQITKALGAAGGRVVIASQAYYRAEVGDRTPFYDGQTDCQNAVTRAVASADPNVDYAELGALICPTRECLEELDGVELRPDGAHFIGDSARLVNTWLLGQAVG